MNNSTALIFGKKSSDCVKCWWFLTARKIAVHSQQSRVVLPTRERSSFINNSFIATSHRDSKVPKSIPSWRFYASNANSSAQIIQTTNKAYRSTATVILDGRVGAETTTPSHSVVATQLQQQMREKEEQELDRLTHHLKNCLDRYEDLLSQQSSSAESTDSTSNSTSTCIALLQEIASTYEQLQDWDKALTIEQVLLEDYYGNDSDNIELMKLRAACLFRQGKLHMRKQDLVHSGRLFRQTLDLYQQVQNELEDADAVKEVMDQTTADKAQVMISLSGTFYYRNRLPESLSLLLETEDLIWPTRKKIVSECDNTILRKVLIKCLQHQGLVHRSMNNFKDALDVYQRALLLMQEEYDEKHKTTTEPAVLSEATKSYIASRQGLRLDIGDMLAALSRHEEAIDLFLDILREHNEQQQQQQDQEHNLEFTKQYDENVLHAVIYHNIGNMYSGLTAQQKSTTNEQISRDDDSFQNLIQAYKYLTRALELKKQWMGDTHPELAKTLNLLGAVHAVFLGILEKNPNINNNTSKFDETDIVQDSHHHRTKAMDCFQHALLIARMHAAGDRKNKVSDENADGESAQRYAHEDSEVLLALRNIAVLKGENVSRWGENK